MTVGVPAREERGGVFRTGGAVSWSPAQNGVPASLTDTALPHTASGPEPGAVTQLCPRGVPGSRVDSTRPAPTGLGPSVTHPGWAGGLVPAADTHDRRPAVSVPATETAPACAPAAGDPGRVGEGHRDQRGGATASQVQRAVRNVATVPGQVPVALLLHVQPTPLPSPRQGPQSPAPVRVTQRVAEAAGRGPPTHAAPTPAGGPGLCGGACPAAAWPPEPQHPSDTGNTASETEAPRESR